MCKYPAFTGPPTATVMCKYYAFKGDPNSNFNVQVVLPFKGTTPTSPMNK